MIGAINKTFSKKDKQWLIANRANIVILIPTEIANAYSLKDLQKLLRINTAIDRYRQENFLTNVAFRFASMVSEVLFLKECQQVIALVDET